MFTSLDNLHAYSGGLWEEGKSHHLVGDVAEWWKLHSYKRPHEYKYLCIVLVPLKWVNGVSV